MPATPEPPHGPPIQNSLSSADLNITEMVDAATIQLRSEQIAGQINQSRAAYASATNSPQKRVKDLSQWVVDVIIETTCQGASLLEVHIIDPLWTLLMRDSNGVSFIDVDAEGFLWPPVEVTYPPDISSAVWRLAQCRPSTDLTQANLILVFEDKIASELREHYGPLTSNADETRAEFIERLVHTASTQPAFPGDTAINFVALLPKETFTPADLSTTTPASATQSNPPPARKDPSKKAPGGALLSGTTASTLTGNNPRGVAISSESAAISKFLDGVEITIQAGWDAMQSGKLFGAPYVPVSWRPSQVNAGLPTTPAGIIGPNGPL